MNNQLGIGNKIPFISPTWLMKYKLTDWMHYKFDFCIFLFMSYKFGKLVQVEISNMIFAIHCKCNGWITMALFPLLQIPLFHNWNHQNWWIEQLICFWFRLVSICFYASPTRCLILQTNPHVLITTTLGYVLNFGIIL